MTTVEKTDGPTRRSLLRLGGASYLGLSLGGLWHAQLAHAGQRVAMAGPPPIKACILLFCYGGPSHLDTLDMKPAAPADVRGDFKPISTSVPGLQICEHLPKLSRLMHHTAIIRTMSHANRLHDAASIESLTGRPLQGGDRELFAPLPQFFPSYGGTLSYLWRDKQLDAPHAALPFVFHNVVETPCQGAGFLGSAYDPLRIIADPAKQVYRGEFSGGGTDSPTRERISQRRHLLTQLETGQSGDCKTSGTERLRKFYDKAQKLLGAAAVSEAIDLSRESEKTRERYGVYAFDPAGGTGGTGSERGIGRNMRGQNLLMARRLVEAGVPFINVYDFRQQGQNWDSHSQNFVQHKEYLLPPLDQALSALIEDLQERGLLETTLVVVMGEFGRTPKINGSAGRDHWPDCYSALLAGGGVTGGGVHGVSDRLGAYPASDPVRPADLAATIFWRFGIDPATHIHDATGRPYRIAEGEPIKQLFAT
jgi:hypothetical protein